MQYRYPSKSLSIRIKSARIAASAVSQRHCKYNASPIYTSRRRSNLIRSSCSVSYHHIIERKGERKIWKRKRAGTKAKLPRHTHTYIYTNFFPPKWPKKKLDRTFASSHSSLHPCGFWSILLGEIFGKSQIMSAERTCSEVKRSSNNLTDLSLRDLVEVCMQHIMANSEGEAMWESR